MSGESERLITLDEDEHLKLQESGQFPEMVLFVFFIVPCLL